MRKDLPIFILTYYDEEEVEDSETEFPAIAKGQKGKEDWDRIFRLLDEV
jgi:hypothetical protein